MAHPFAHYLMNYNYPPTQAGSRGFADTSARSAWTTKAFDIGGDPELSPNGTKTLFRNLTRDANTPHRCPIEAARVAQMLTSSP